MSINLTVWRPAAEVMTPAVQALSAVVRRALPAGVVFGTAGWEHGTRQNFSEEGLLPSAPVIHLESLTWRLRENLEVGQRGMGEWSFSGFARVTDKRVDFSGEYLRDMATGAFWEFRLHTLG